MCVCLQYSSFSRAAYPGEPGINSKSCQIPVCNPTCTLEAVGFATAGVPVLTFTSTRYNGILVRGKVFWLSPSILHIMSYLSKTFYIATHSCIWQIQRTPCDFWGARFRQTSCPSDWVFITCCLCGGEERKKLHSLFKDSICPSEFMNCCPNLLCAGPGITVIAKPAEYMQLENCVFLCYLKQVCRDVSIIWRWLEIFNFQCWWITTYVFKDVCRVHIKARALQWSLEVIQNLGHFTAWNQLKCWVIFPKIAKYNISSWGSRMNFRLIYNVHLWTNINLTWSHDWSYRGTCHLECCILRVIAMLII